MPLSDVVGKVKEESFWHTEANAVNVGTSCPLQVMVKLLFEISKNVPAEEITITLAVLVVKFGHTMVSEPSLAVDEEST